MSTVTDKNIVFLITSADKLKDVATGTWLEEIAAPYYMLLEAGFKITLASVKGGEPPVDADSLQAHFITAECTRFQEDVEAQAKFKDTLALEKVDASLYQAIFLPGGHGTCADFIGNNTLSKLIADIYTQGGIVSAVCHGPNGLVNVEVDGKPLVAGKKVCGFTDAEEKMVGKEGIVDFLLQTRLVELGAQFQEGDAWSPKAVVDQRLITGQNPQSSSAVGALIVEAFAN